MALKPCNYDSGKSLLNPNTNFDDLHKPLSLQQAIAESDRCLYCYDAPCIEACPTTIDIPTFIHQIRTENMTSAATTILSENIMGGTCARVCPTEVLCEQVCVLNTSMEQPVEIGALQRYAVDNLIANNDQHPFIRASQTGKNIAVIGAGPAGLSCAHRLASLGHSITVFEAKEKSGGLNEYGLAAYKMVDDFAQREVKFLLAIGGIDINHNQKLGTSVSLKSLQAKYDAVFIGVGLADTYSLGLENEFIPGVMNAVDFIETIRVNADKSQVKVGNDVVVIGAGNTAIDAAVQAKRLGAENVTLVYRRGVEHMGATEFELNLARTNGVVIKLWSSPTAIVGSNHITAIRFTKTAILDGKLTPTEMSFTIKADMLLKAIGQKLDKTALNDIQLDKGKIFINTDYQTSIKGVYAGGDAINSGEDLTVQAVEDGKQAAIAINIALMEEK